MKKITVKVPDSLEKAFVLMVKAEFGGNYNRAVNSLIATKLELEAENLVTRVERLENKVKNIEGIVERGRS